MEDMSNVTVKPGIIVKSGKPTAVVLDIRIYEHLLEAAEEKDDLLELRRIKKSKTSFRVLEDFLNCKNA